MLENLSALELVNTMTTKSVVRLFEEGLEAKNVFVAGTAIKMLAKRGDYDKIALSLNKAFDNGLSFRLDSEFAVMLQNMLFDVRNSSSALGVMAKKLSARMAEDDEKIYDKKLYEEDKQTIGEMLPKQASSMKMKGELTAYDCLSKLTIADCLKSFKTLKHIEDYLEQLTPREVAAMKADEYEAIVSHITRIEMQTTGTTREYAVGEALKLLNEKLNKQLIVIAHCPGLRKLIKGQMEAELFSD